MFCCYGNDSLLAVHCIIIKENFITKFDFFLKADS